MVCFLSMKLKTNYDISSKTFQHSGRENLYQSQDHKTTYRLIKLSPCGLRSPSVKTYKKLKIKPSEQILACFFIAQIVFLIYLDDPFI